MRSICLAATALSVCALPARDVAAREPVPAARWDQDVKGRHDQDVRGHHCGVATSMRAYVETDRADQIRADPSRGRVVSTGLPSSRTGWHVEVVGGRRGGARRRPSSSPLRYPSRPGGEVCWLSEKRFTAG